MISESVRSTCSAPCSAVSFSLETSLPTWPSVTSRAFSQAGVHELLVDVLEQDGDVGGGDDLGDLPAHDARADHRGFEDEHGADPR